VHDVASHLPTNRPLSEHVWQNRLTLLDALRFRANIYMTGPPAFAEDSWKKAKIAEKEYHISCRTTRCKLPNVDPETAEMDKNEPLSTLRRYRVIDEGSKNACLGMQVSPLQDGAVAVGDSIEVLETGQHFFLGGEGRKVEG
jgi:uncharacterized protein YcbX